MKAPVGSFITKINTIHDDTATKMDACLDNTEARVRKLMVTDLQAIQEEAEVVVEQQDIPNEGMSTETMRALEN